MRLVAKVSGVVSIAFCLILLAGFLPSDNNIEAQTPPPPLKVRPRLPVEGAAVDFSPPENAYDGPSSAAVLFVNRHCKDLCSGAQNGETTWSAFPAGYRPQRLVVRWRAEAITTGLAQGDTAFVRATIQYKLGAASWEVLEMFESFGTDSTSFHDKAVELPTNTDSGTIEVKATMETDLHCNVNCTGFSHAGGSASVADIWLEVTPILTVTPTTPTRGTSVTFTVERVPNGAVSNWRYEPTNLPYIDRVSNPNAVTWPGTLVVSGTVRANGVVPATLTNAGATRVGQQLYAVSSPVTVAPRSGWFSTAKDPQKVAPGTPALPRCPANTLTVMDPEFCVSGGSPSSIGRSRVCFNWDKVNDPKQVDDSGGPNHGIWWLPTFEDLTSYNWAVHQKIDPGNATFCANQCGNVPLPNSACSTRINDVVTTCAMAREFLARHEASQVQNSHWLQYQAAQNDPSRNFKVGAESLVGAPSLTLTGFQNTVENAMAAREFAIKTLTAPENPCNNCSADCSEFWGHLNCRLGFPSGSWRWACQ
jgi:hypothetical protein